MSFYYTNNRRQQPIANAVAMAPVSVRTSFIRTVYGILFSSLVVTIVAGVFAANAASAIMPLMPLLFVAYIVLGLIMAFVRRTTGVNIFLLYMFSGVLGLMLGPYLMAANQVAPGTPALAAALTFFLFGGLSLYTIISGINFSFLGGFLNMALIGLLIAGIFLIFFHIPFLSILYSLGGVLIFSGYVLYDTSNVMNRHSAEEPISAAIALYLDVINLFLFILQLLMDMNRRD